MRTDVRHSEFSDKWGVLLSSVCFFHCVGIMILVPFAPFFQSAMPGLSFHFVILPLIVLAALMGLVGGYRRHHTLTSVLLGLAGIAFVSIEAVVEEFLHHSSSSSLFDSHLIAAVGSLLLVVAHLYNVRLLRLIDSGEQSRNCLHPLC